ncbi:ribonucleoside-diphosphate reductase subunit alpha [Woeseia oceani]|uniref:Ribonucleoside-diphosphate reductase n=1 Tax=Woeseia oceani TaxID=1548547 RepID=A0A193LJ95_9GAMM|nr:ribonucleoside-diphosphate reductase subunit alpha [Woeseia oceani]ANO52526.1 ribonucleotide-diphosphate reductase subunit alpha [Woeseia oceani]
MAQPALSTTTPPVMLSPETVIHTDPTRDERLTEFGKATMRDRYLLPGESYQDLFARVAKAYADDQQHAQRLYDYMSKLWFMPATPILSNGGTARGLPISCFLNAVEDSLDGIVGTWMENVWLASNGGGIGTYWGDVRSIGETVKGNGQTSGIIPFVRVMDSLTLAISQGSLRRGSAAVYLDIYHPEIEEFIEIRKPSGDFNRKSLNLHHGIAITDEFMEAVREGRSFSLRSPATQQEVRTVSARELWQKILETRLQTGEPYLLFVDTANRDLANHQKQLGLKVRQSNLCSEILLPTGRDSSGNLRTAVCCLASVNLVKWDEWRQDQRFVEDIFRFLDNVLEDFIVNAPDSMSHAKYSAMRERSVGLGAMGFHTYLQGRGIPFESALAKSWNIRVFKHLRAEADKASVRLARERGACPDAADAGVMERFSHKLSIAPTASISIICGGTSACIEPIPGNIYTHKTLSGSFTVKNPELEKLLRHKGLDTEETWASILQHDGSVQHFECLNEDEKAVFRTSFEIDQRWVIDLAADRAPSICQGQSVNLFLNSDLHKWDLLMLHWLAWERGIKSLYYCRSKSVQRAGYAGVEADNTQQWPERALATNLSNYDECLACQ